MAAVIVGMAFGCSASMKNRREYAESITMMGCEKYDQCGRIGPGRDFRSKEECNNAMLWKIYDEWPEAECDGTINPNRFKSCESKAAAVQCDGNFLDTVVALEECDKQQLCVDSRKDKTLYPKDFRQASAR